MNPPVFFAWLLTSLAGFILFATWVSGGGIRHGKDGTSRPAPEGVRSAFRAPLVLGHLGLAAAGLMAWIVHLVSGSSTAAWVTVAIAVPLVVLGMVMLAMWLNGRGAAANDDPTTRPPEQWFPSSVVLLHGIGATVTVILVVIAAARS